VNNRTALAAERSPGQRVVVQYPSVIEVDVSAALEFAEEGITLPESWPVAPFTMRYVLPSEYVVRTTFAEFCTEHFKEFEWEC
jgi:hypothetical protein